MNAEIPNKLAEISISYSADIKPDERVRVRCSRDSDKVLRKMFPSLEHRECFIWYVLSGQILFLGIIKFQWEESQGRYQI